MKKPLLAVWVLLCGLAAAGQPAFSLGTGVSVLRQFSPQQRFWTVGQTVRPLFHFSTQQTAYVSFDYFTDGNVRNRFVAVGKTPAVQPAAVQVDVRGRFALQQLSLGWRRYLRGGFNAEGTMSVYGAAGFGLLFGRVENSVSLAVDTGAYSLPVRIGAGPLRKLTFDLGAGVERSVGGQVYAFADVRGWLPASTSESAFLHNQKNVPLSLTASLGLRILFGLFY